MENNRYDIIPVMDKYMIYDNLIHDWESKTLHNSIKDAEIYMQSIFKMCELMCNNID